MGSELTQFKKGNKSWDNQNNEKTRFKKGHKNNLGKHWKVKNTINISGENSSHWQGGITFEEYSLDWRETLRRSIRERDRYTCKICGKQQGDVLLAIHHIDYDKKNCNPNNLITLCIKCHSKTNHNRNYWEDCFKVKVGGESVGAGQSKPAI